MSSSGDQNFFPDAKNVVISGGTFTSVKSPSSTRRGLKLLLRNISQGAFHNAAERGEPPRCHPHTRKAIRAEIMEWITAPRAMRKLILWMYGPAGSGKTAIAQSIAEECERLGILAASFFFWRTAAGRNNASRFVATIAYQLSRRIPQMEEHLFAAIEEDPTIFSRSLSTQMRVLVTNSFKLVAPSLSIPIFAIVDGVDECGPDGQSQSELLHLLGSVASELQHCHFPLIFLIASRPEYEIREAFNESLLRPLTKILVLDNSYKPDEDIKLYFDFTFRDIYEKHRRLGRRLPSQWPAANDVNYLVSKASGQFIFAATVTKFIDSPRHNPADRMNIILRLSTSGNETPFALLDALYRFVLDSVAHIEDVLDILAFLLLHDYNDHIGSLDQAEDLLDIEFRSALVDMHSLLFVPSPAEDDLPTVYHASLEDFLMDQSRSRQYYIGTREGHLRISQRCLKTLGSHQRLQYISAKDVVNCFVNHAAKSPTSQGSLVNDLAQLDLRAFLEGVSHFNIEVYNTNWKGFFDCVKQQTGPDRLDIFLRLRNDFDAFILDRLAQYPPSLRTHIPVLLCFLHLLIHLDIFRILLYGACSSAEEYNEFVSLDERLLRIRKAAPGPRLDDSGFEEDDIYVSNLFQDKSRAGEYFVDGGSYAALAKAIASVICLEPGKKNHGFSLVELGGKRDGDHLKAGYDPTTQIRLIDVDFWFFEVVVRKASKDIDLANFLWEYAVRYRNDMTIRGQRRIAEASMKYIQRCGIPLNSGTFV